MTSLHKRRTPYPCVGHPVKEMATYHREKAPDEKHCAPIGVRSPLNSSDKSGSRDNRSSIRKVSIGSSPCCSSNKSMHHNRRTPPQPPGRTAVLALRNRTQLCRMTSYQIWIRFVRNSLLWVKRSRKIKAKVQPFLYRRFGRSWTSVVQNSEVYARRAASKRLFTDIELA
jgi:hypothetical protein